MDIIIFALSKSSSSLSTLREPQSYRCGTQINSEQRVRDPGNMPLRPACSQNRAGSYKNYAGSDFPHPVRFRSCKGAPDHNFIVQNQSGSDLGGLVRFWSNASGPKTNRCAKNNQARFWPTLPSRSGIFTGE